MKSLRCLLALVLLLPPMVDARPKIGLVLSGGGARGAAHIGVLKFLDDHDIPVDVITGTSMGAIVGGLYAAGYSGEEIERIAVEMDWNEKLDDNVPRKERSLQRKRIEDQFSIGVSPGFSDGQVKFPFGAIQGQKITLEMQRLTSHVVDVRDFRQLPIAFAAVATDVGTGEAVIMDQGDLALAMRASMGVPAVFAPVQIDGRLLVDGGVTNNLPVDVARSMGAEVLIVVNIGSPLYEPDQITNIFAITDQLTRMMTNQNTQAQLAQLREGDVFLAPDLGDFSSAAFDQAAAAIVIGHDAALEHQQALLALQEPGHQRPPRPVAKERVVARVTLDNDSGLHDRRLDSLIHTEPGEMLDLDKLEEDLSAIHGLGNFQRVGYSLAGTAGATDLNVLAEAKSWGPRYLHVGLEAESQFNHSSKVTLLLGYSAEELNDKGAEWTTMIGLGDEPRLQTLYYQPLTYHRDWFFTASAGAIDEQVAQYSGNDRIASRSLRQLSGLAALGYEFNNHWMVMAGASIQSGSQRIITGDPSLPVQDFHDAAVSIKALYDTRDDVDFPARGGMLELDIRLVSETLGADRSYEQWQLRGSRYFRFGHHNIGFAADLGGIDGGSNPGSVFRIGGYGQITGLHTDQLTGNYKAIGSATYYRRFDGIPVIEGIIGTIVEYGGVWQTREDIDKESALLSVGVFAGADTPIGTLQIGYAVTDNNNSAVFSRIGRVF